MSVLETDDRGDVLVGCNIDAFSGQTAELRLAARNDLGNFFTRLEIDDIKFSSQPIPEPSSLIILLIGSCLPVFDLGRRRVN